MMKHFFLGVVWFILPLLSLAQKENYNWVVRDNIIVHFTDTLPFLTKIQGNLYTPTECHASFSDTIGNLLLYTDAGRWQRPFSPDTIWHNSSVIRNSKHDTIINGSNINMNNSITNGALFIKYDINIIYLFHLDQKYIDPTPPEMNDSLRYIQLFMTIIERKDSNWVVTVKNKLLSGKLRLVEKLAAVRHANGQDWWIITHDFYRNIFHTFLFRDGEITDSFSQETGYAFKDGDLTPPYVGEVCVSPDGSMILLANRGGDLNKTLYDTELFRFDRCCGKISFYNSLKQKNFYGAAFSPNNRFIYLCKMYGITYQYDTESSDIQATEVQVSPFPYIRDWGFSGAQLELGTDERLYCMSQQSKYLGAILYPDKKGKECNFKPDFIDGKGNFFGATGLPSFPNYRLGALAPSYYRHDTTVCPDKKTAIGIPPDCDYTYEWSPTTGLSDTFTATPTVKINQDMTYIRRTFSSRFGCTLRYDTFFVKVLEKNVPPCTSNARPEYLSPFELSLYPNPASETATLNYELPKDIKAEVRVIDITGRLLFSFPLAKDKGKYEFSVKDLSAGIYLVEVRLSNGEKMIQKLTVQD